MANNKRQQFVNSAKSMGYAVRQEGDETIAYPNGRLTAKNGSMPDNHLNHPYMVDKANAQAIAHANFQAGPSGVVKGPVNSGGNAATEAYGKALNKAYKGTTNYGRGYSY